jgi:hypothetical protein
MMIRTSITTQLTVHRSKTIMVKTIKEAHLSYLFTLAFETSRIALNSLASHHITEQLQTSSVLLVD